MARGRRRGGRGGKAATRMWEGLGFVLLAANLLVLWDIVRRPVDTGNKLVWIALVWLFPFLGLLLYLLVGRGSLIRVQRAGRSHY